MNDNLRQMFDEIRAIVDAENPEPRRKGIMEVRAEITAEIMPFAKTMLYKYEKGWLSLDEAQARIDRAFNTRFEKAMKARHRDIGRRQAPLVGHREAILAVQSGMTYLEAGMAAGFQGDADYIVKKVARAVEGAREAATYPSVARRRQYLRVINEGLSGSDQLRFVVNRISGEVFLLPLHVLTAWRNDPSD